MHRRVAQKRVGLGHIGARFCGFLREILPALRDFPDCKTVQKRAETCPKRAKAVKNGAKAVRKRASVEIVRPSDAI